MSEEPKFLTCTCDHCSQRLEFPGEGVGTKVKCPTCGQTTLLYWIQPKPSVPVPPPIPPPARPARPTPPIGKSGAAKLGDAPLSADSKRSAPPKTEFVIRFSRQTVIRAFAVAMCLALLVPVGFWTFQRVSEGGKAKKELAAELRLLAANLQTGINNNDFLQQAARVRAAYAGAKAYLTPEQNEKFARIDCDLLVTTAFWDKEIEYPNQSTKSYLTDSIAETDKRISTFLNDSP